jgi:hypothetical protein
VLRAVQGARQVFGMHVDTRVVRYYLQAWGHLLFVMRHGPYCSCVTSAVGRCSKQVAPSAVMAITMVAQHLL